MRPACLIRRWKVCVRLGGRLGAGLGHHVLGRCRGHDLALWMTTSGRRRGPRRTGAVAHSTPILSAAAELMDVLDDAAPGRDVEADGRLVEQQQFGLCSRARAISTRRRWPPFSARTRSSSRSAMSSASSASSMRSSASRRADAVERGEVAQVLLDGQIEVERRLLEHDAHMRPAPASDAPAGRARRSRSCRAALRTAA